MKTLNARPELELILDEITKGEGGKLTFPSFLEFMRNIQKVCLLCGSIVSDLLLMILAIPRLKEDLKQLFVNVLTAPEQITTATEFASTQPPRVLPQETPASVTWENDAWKAEDFISFLSSQENSAFGEESRVWMDMARPLSEHYISSSHNTYLVGHQFMGASTIEGYIRALLHSCRCVERKWHPNFIPPLVPSPHIWSSWCSTVDIYDGDCEPAVCHGRTSTSKVPVREVCEAIAKYGFVTSPYPVTVYAEVHCGLD